MKIPAVFLFLTFVASAQIYVKDYATCNGTTVEQTGILAAIAAAANEPLIFPPGKTCVCDPAATRIYVNDRTIDATGTTLKNCYFGTTAGSLNWTGGKIVQDGTTDNYNSPRFNISGATGVHITGLGCVDVFSYACFQISNSNNVWITDSDIYQSNLNSITVTAGKNLHFSGIHMSGAAGGSDDGIALVNGGDITNVTIDGTTGENVYDILKIVNSAFAVRNVTVNGCSGTNVEAPLYIQSQGSTTQDITFANCNFFDQVGTMASNIVRIAISGGNVLRNVNVNNVAYRGRTLQFNNNPVQIVNTQSTIEGLRFDGIVWDDIYNGVATGGSTPGYPAATGFTYSTVTSGTATDVRLSNWRINGTATYGVRITSPISNCVVENSLFKNIYKTNPAGTMFSVTAGTCTDLNNAWIH